MLKFFRVLEDKEKAAREALDRSAKLKWSVDYGVPSQEAKEFANQIDRAREFMDQADKVRDFFAAFLEKKQGPAFDFKVQLRVIPDREEEIGGEQIIDWKLEIGKKKFSYLSDDLTGHWVLGDPIRLSLRWANNSPSRPVAGALPVPFTVKDRTAVFEYDDPWSLFTFLLRHGLRLQRAGAQQDCDQGFEADPYTLKFTIKTEPDPAGVPSERPELKLTPAKVFLRLSLVSANKQEPLLLPCFPIEAPATPSLSPNSLYQDD
jgi:type VI secretion system protein ImpL